MTRRCLPVIVVVRSADMPTAFVSALSFSPWMNLSPDTSMPRSTTSMPAPWPIIFTSSGFRISMLWFMARAAISTSGMHTSLALNRLPIFSMPSSRPLFSTSSAPTFAASSAEAEDQCGEAALPGDSDPSVGSPEHGYLTYMINQVNIVTWLTRESLI
jgi:hypothetical protein